MALNLCGERSKGKKKKEFQEREGAKKKRAKERGGARSTKSEPLPCIRVFRDMRGHRDTQEGEKLVSRDSRVFLLAPRENAGILSSLGKKTLFCKPTSFPGLSPTRSHVATKIRGAWERGCL